jgi:hypothetical protein
MEDDIKRQANNMFSQMSLDECILYMNKEVEKVQNGGGGTGWARNAYYAALKERFQGFEIDTSSFIIDVHGHITMSFAKKIHLLEGKIIQID